ncbi:MAG: NnrS family protein [Verrucomicrobiaceae bacterium]|nr:NnrS family protein [Verrucomicrobiaceae bacterium]
MSRCRHSPDAPSSPPCPEGWTWFWSEPFRLFFPWGLIVGVTGAALWPLFYTTGNPATTAIAHPLLMTLGWGGAFIIGFLGTAGPRMIGAEPLSKSEVRILWLLHAAGVVACLQGHIATAGMLLGGALVMLLVLFAARFAKRKDMPPPGFVIAFMGLLSGITGTAMVATGLDVQWGAWSFRLARLLMFEAFLLLPILGVGGFLLPRILGLPSRQSLPDSINPSPQWLKMALGYALLGALLIASFFLEASEQIVAAMVLRIALALMIWNADLPGLWTQRVTGTQAWMIRLGLAALPISWAARAFFPGGLLQRIALEHLLFISGFGVIMLGVASRVVDGHSGNRADAKGTSKILRWIFWLATLAMLTRVTAGFLPKIMVSHHNYAALTWVILSGLWLYGFGKKLATADPEA